LALQRISRPSSFGSFAVKRTRALGAKNSQKWKIFNGPTFPNEKAADRVTAAFSKGRRLFGANQFSSSTDVRH